MAALLEAHPETPAIIDHWGFFHQDGRDVEEAWAQLLALAKYPQVGFVMIWLVWLDCGGLSVYAYTMRDLTHHHGPPKPHHTHNSQPRHTPPPPPPKQLSVKVSAFFRVSSAPWPFADLAPRLEQLKKAYGSHRLMWGR